MSWLTTARLEDLEASGEAEEPAAVLDQFADVFLRAGGVVTPEGWAALSLRERAALARAGDRLRALWAAQIGTAGLGPEAAAVVIEPADGGHLRRSLALQAATRAVAAELAANAHGPRP